jgi:rare lipoprotein A
LSVGLRLRLAVTCTAVAVLGACASTAPRSSGESPSPAAQRPGGYYLDDGPQANPPADLDSVPDAQPRAEPIRAANARPYTALGKSYVPMTALQPYSETGVASWYGKRYHGQPTASGEIYDMYAMTAAHPTLPIPSYARVTRADSSRSVVVRINDRGPFHSDRIIDLSYTAAYKLGILADGSAAVRVESIIPGEDLPAEARPVETAYRPPPATPAPAEEDKSPAALAPGVYLQLGAFASRDNAESFLRRMRAELPSLDGLATIAPGESLYRVQAGPYAHRAQAQQMAERIERILDLKPIVLTR